MAGGCFPFLLNWEGSLDNYPSEWISGSIEEMARKMIDNEKLDLLEKNDLRENNFKFIENRFSLELIFPKLAKILLNE